MRKVTTQISLFGVIFTFILFWGCQAQILDKQGCKKISSCYSHPPNCDSSDNCEYLLKYSLSGTTVTFELSSNKYKWVAVGFNNVKSMVKGRSLSCETRNSKVVLNHYDMPFKSRPKPSLDKKATLLSNQSNGTVLYCRFTREQDLGAGRYDLSKPVFFLYAAGQINSDKIIFHDYMDTSAELVKLTVLTDNTIVKGKAEKKIDTADCGKTKSCLRDPANCKDNTVCNYVVTFEKSGSDQIEFSVSGKADGWIAVGFNDNPKMKNTDAVICQGSGQNVKLWTAKLEYSSPDLKKTNEIKLTDGLNKGGIIYCKFLRPLKSGEMLDIDVTRYLIYGRGSGTGSLNKHKTDDRGCSEIKVDFSGTKNYKLGDCEASDLYKVHASLMIFSWMFLVVVSIFIARYSRSLWSGLKILEKDAWFQFHRILMGIAVLLTIISIIIIFVDKKGWSESAGDHAVYGIIVLVLALIQPVVAFFRPHPGTPRRFIFTWFHRFVALLLIIFAVVSVFKGAFLIEDSGGEVTWKITIVLLVIALVTALILEYLAFRVRNKKTESTNDNASTEKIDMETPDQTFWEEKAQQALLVVLSVVVLILALTMIAYTAGAGMDDDDDNDDDD